MVKDSERFEKERTLLSNERTLLSYLRTAFAAFIFGFALIQFGQNNQTLTSMGYAAIVTGTALAILGFIHYSINRKRISR